MFEAGFLLQVKELSDVAINNIPDNNCLFSVSLLSIILLLSLWFNWIQYKRGVETQDRQYSSQKQHKDTLETLIALQKRDA